MILENLYPKLHAITDEVGLREVIVTKVTDFMPFPVNLLAPMRMKKEAKHAGEPWPRVPPGAKVKWWKELMAGSYPAVPPVEVDAKNDLAVIRMDGHPAGAAPLWQHPRTPPPAPGDALLLVGSPYGLSGTVTKGIVSRVTSSVIQTDAAANPGNSGGPAVDQQGNIVGVLVAGIKAQYGSGLNFAVPIARMCERLRHC